MPTYISQLGMLITYALIDTMEEVLKLDAKDWNPFRWEKFMRGFFEDRISELCDKGDLVTENFANLDWWALHNLAADYAEAVRYGLHAYETMVYSSGFTWILRSAATGDQNGVLATALRPYIEEDNDWNKLDWDAEWVDHKGDVYSLLGDLEAVEDDFNNDQVDVGMDYRSLFAVAHDAPSAMDAVASVNRTRHLDSELIELMFGPLPALMAADRNNLVGEWHEYGPVSAVEIQTVGPRINPLAYATEVSIVKDGTRCAICMEVYELGEEDPWAKVVNCGHQYHRSCLDSLVNHMLPRVDAVKCAACRGYIRPRRMICPALDPADQQAGRGYLFPIDLTMSAVLAD